MNQKLTDQIIRHIYNCLGIKLPGKISKIYSIMQPEYLLNQKIPFEDGDNKVWGLEFDLSKFEDSVMQILLADLTQDGIPEYALMASTKDAPFYACYLSYDEYNKDPNTVLDRSMIACCLQDGSWAECNVYLQGAFLCGMEKVREVNSPFRKITDKEVFQKLISFIQFYQETMERENEGQEDR